MLTRTMKQTRPGSTRRKSVYALGFAISAMFLLSACSDEQSSAPETDMADTDAVASVCDHVLGQYGYAYPVIESACSDEAARDRSAEESVAEICNLVLEHYPYAHRGLVRDGVCS